jgi:hypothetical protein
MADRHGQRLAADGVTHPATQAPAGTVQFGNVSHGGTPGWRKHSWALTHRFGAMAARANLRGQIDAAPRRAPRRIAREHG